MEIIGSILIIIVVLGTIIFRRRLHEVARAALREAMGIDLGERYVRAGSVATIAVGSLITILVILFMFGAGQD